MDREVPNEPRWLKAVKDCEKCLPCEVCTDEQPCVGALSALGGCAGGKDLCDEHRTYRPRWTYCRHCKKHSWWVRWQCPDCRGPANPYMVKDSG